MRRSAALSRSGCRLKPAFQAVIPSTGGTLPSGSSCGDDWGGTVPPCSAPRAPTRGRRSRTRGAVKEGSSAPFRCALAQRLPAGAGVPSRYCRDRGGSVSSCVCDADGWRDAVSTASGRSMPARGRRSEADLRFPPRARSSFTTLSRSGCRPEAGAPNTPRPGRLERVPAWRPVFTAGSRVPATTYSPTALPLQYHRRWRTLLPCSEWERVWPLRSGHRDKK